MTAKCDNPSCVGGRVPCEFYKQVNPGLTFMTCPDECPPDSIGPALIPGSKAQAWCTLPCPTCKPDAEGERVRCPLENTPDCGEGYSKDRPCPDGFDGDCTVPAHPDAPGDAEDPALLVPHVAFGPVSPETFVISCHNEYVHKPENRSRHK